MRLRALSRNLLPIAVFGFATTLSYAQSRTAPDNKPAPGQPQTVVGCLTGYDGHYTLGASDDTLYLLEGDDAAFKRYNAKMVKATGTITESAPGTSRHNVLSQQPPKMKVIELKKVADGCN
jgi:hypothetical protein